MAKVKLMTQAEYAAHRGCSAVAVYKAVKAGRISLIDGKIDPVVADIQWEQNTRARISPQAAARAEAAQDLVGQAQGATPAEPPAAAAPAAAPDTGYSQARARRENAEAETAEIELKKLRGELVLREDVARGFYEIAREIRDRLISTGRRIAAEVSSLQSAEACEAVIEREHRLALELLVKGLREKLGTRLATDDRQMASKE